MTVFNPRLSDDYLSELQEWEDTRKDFNRFVQHVKTRWYQSDTAFTVYLESDGYHYAYTDRIKNPGFTNPIARFERDENGEYQRVEAAGVAAEREA